MMKTGVVCPWENQMAHSQLPDSSEALEIRMFDQVEQNIVWKS